MSGKPLGFGLTPRRTTINISDAIKDNSLSLPTRDTRSTSNFAGFDISLINEEPKTSKEEIDTADMPLEDIDQLVMERDRSQSTFRKTKKEANSISAVNEIGFGLNPRRTTIDTSDTITENSPPLPTREIRSTSYFEGFDMDLADEEPEILEEEKDTVDMALEDIDKLIMEKDRTQISFRKTKQEATPILDITQTASLFSNSKLDPSKRTGIARSPGSFILDHSSSDYSFDSDKEDYDSDLEPENEQKKQTGEKANYTFGHKVENEMHKIQKEFSVIQKEVSKTRGKLEIDLNNFDKLCEKEVLPEVRKKIINPSLYEILNSKTGKPSCFATNSQSSIFFFGTETGKIVMYNIKNLEMVEAKPVSSNAVPNTMLLLEKKGILLTGTKTGSIDFYYFSQDPFKIKKLFSHQLSNQNGVVKLIAAGANTSSFLAVDCEGALHYFKTPPGRLEKTKIFSKELYYLTRDTVPNFAVKEISAEIDLVIVSHGRRVSLFKHAELQQESIKLVKEIEFEERETEISESFLVIGEITINKIRRNFLLVSWGYSLNVYELMNSFQCLPVLSLETAFKIDYAGGLGNGYVVLQEDTGKIQLLDLERVFNEAELIEDFGPKTQLFDFLSDSNSTTEEALSSPPRYRSQSVATRPELPGQQKENYHRRGTELLKEINDEYSISDILIWKAAGGRLKSRGQFIISRDTQIFFLTKSGLSCFERMTYNDHLQLLIEQKSYLFGLKTVNNLLDGEKSMLTKTENFRALQRDLGSYLQTLILQAIPTLENKDHSTKKLVSNYIMLLLAKTGQFDFMVQTLESSMTLNGLSSHYYRTLKLFYESQLLPFLDQKQISNILGALEEKELQKMQFLFFVFKRGQFRNLIIREAGKSKFYFLLTIFAAKRTPEAVMSPITQLQAQLLQETEKPQKQKILLKIFWIINKIQSEFDLNKEGSENGLGSDSYLWQCLTWLFDRRSIKFFTQQDLIIYLESIFYLLKSGLAHSANKLITPLGTDCRPFKPQGILKKGSNRVISDFFDLILEVISEESKNGSECNLCFFYLFLAIASLGKHKEFGLSDKFVRLVVKQLVKNSEKLTKNKELAITNDSLNILIFTLFDDNKELLVGDEELSEIVKTKE